MSARAPRGPDELDEKRQASRCPERARISWGKAIAGPGVRGTDFCARGGYIDALFPGKFNRGAVRTGVRARRRDRGKAGSAHPRSNDALFWTTSSFFYHNRDRLAASRPSVAEGSAYTAGFRPRRLQSQTVETLNGVPRRKSGSCRLAGGGRRIQPSVPRPAGSIRRPISPPIASTGGTWIAEAQGRAAQIS